MSTVLTETSFPGPVVFAERRCDHCGNRFQPRFQAEKFCCSGCRVVHDLIQSGGFGSFYELLGRRVLQPATELEPAGDQLEEIAEAVTAAETERPSPDARPASPCASAISPAPPASGSSTTFSGSIPGSAHEQRHLALHPHPLVESRRIRGPRIRARPPSLRLPRLDLSARGGGGSAGKPRPSHPPRRHRRARDEHDGLHPAVVPGLETGTSSTASSPWSPLPPRPSPLPSAAPISSSAR